MTLAKWKCRTCGYKYDEEEKGKKFEMEPEDWKCFKCGAVKSRFEKT